MKRAQLIEPHKPLVISETEIPTAPPDGALIKTAYGGICHSDLHQYEDCIQQGKDQTPLRFSMNPLYKFPIVLGHEISGTIESFGSNFDSNASDLKVGDRVVVYPWLGCRKCNYCSKEHPDKCENPHLKFGLGLDGGYGTYITVPEVEFVIKVPDSVQLDVACMFTCSGLVTYSAVKTVLPYVEDAVKIKGKARALIIGAGGLGLWSIQIAKSILPSQCTLVVADIDEAKLEMAKTRGCDESIHWDSSLKEGDLVKRSVEKGHFDAVIDYVNNTTTANRGCNCLAMNGVLALVGLFGGQALFSLPMMVVKCRSVKGVMVGNVKDMKELMELAASKKVIPPPLRYFKLEEVNTALNLMKNGKIEGRGIIDHTQS